MPLDFIAMISPSLFSLLRQKMVPKKAAMGNVSLRYIGIWPVRKMNVHFIDAWCAMSSGRRKKNSEMKNNIQNNDTPKKKGLINSFNMYLFNIFMSL